MDQHSGMADDLIVKTLDESEYERWDRFVDESPYGGIYNQSYFLDALCRALGTHFRILAVFKHDELLGGAGLHFVPGQYGDMVQLRPLLYYNGLVIKDFESKYPSITESRQAEVIQAILGELEGGKYASAELSNRHPLSDLRPFLRHGWQVFPRYTYIVPVSDPLQQWEHVEQNLRRLISRCERDGVRLEPSEDADAFYSMYENTYLRKGVQPYILREKFIELHRVLRTHNACQIYFAVMPDGRRAAGEIVLMSKHPVTHTWMAGSDPEFLRTGASAFLRWKVFEDLHRRGYAYNDLTDAMNDHVAKFKSQFGGRLETSFVVHNEFSSRLRIRNRIRRVAGQSINLMRRMFARRSRDNSGQNHVE
jgi:Acetyltransferase (GNAT) domain